MFNCKKVRLRVEEIGKYTVREERTFIMLQQMVHTVTDALEGINFSLNSFRSYQFIIHFFLLYNYTFIYIKNRCFA